MRAARARGVWERGVRGARQQGNRRATEGARPGVRLNAGGHFGEHREAASAAQGRARLHARVSVAASSWDGCMTL